MNQPSSKQKEAIGYLSDKTTNFVGYGGAAFGGKSYLLCTWIITMCLMYPDTGWGIGRKELVTLKKTTLITLFKVFEEMNIRPDRDYAYNGTLNVITFSNKSQIFLIDTAFKPLDPLYTRFGGYELTGAAIDESAETPLEAINILFTRLGRRNNHKYGLQKKMLETFNPQKNHVYFRYYKPNKEGTLKPTYKFITALPQDNPSPEVPAYIKGILDNSDKVTIERLIKGNFEYDDDPTMLILYDAMLDTFSNDHVPKGKKYITADIALHGSDSFVMFAWDGWRIIDIVSMPKTNGSEVEKAIKEFAKTHQVPQSHIVYDADGIGAFLKGYLQTSVSFNNGSLPIQEKNKNVNYTNLKTQCYFKLAEKINNAQVYISPDVYEKKINHKQVRETILEESGVIKKNESVTDKKLALIPKKDMKELIGRSPDYMDAMMMRMIFELKPNSFKAPRASIMYND